MFCSKCGAVLEDGKPYCPNCGAAVQYNLSEQSDEPGQAAQAGAFGPSGNPAENTGTYITSGSAGPVQTASGTAVAAQPVVQVRENIVTGTVGALLGAVIGGASILLLGRFGFISSLSGLILAVCTLKGYELLGKSISKIGLAICFVLMLVMPYLADRIDWAILVMQEFDDVSFSDAFAVIPALIREEAIEMSDYVKNLLMLYLFVILGAFSTLRGLVRK